MVIINNGELLIEFANLIHNAHIQIFVWVVLFDILTGLCKGIFVKDANSTKGLLGVVKHLLVTMLILVAYPYLKILGFETIATTFVWFYIAMYGISITENFGQLGLPIPDWVKDRLSKLQDTTNKNQKKD